MKGTRRKKTGLSCTPTLPDVGSAINERKFLKNIIGAVAITLTFLLSYSANLRPVADGEVLRVVDVGHEMADNATVATPSTSTLKDADLGSTSKGSPDTNSPTLRPPKIKDGEQPYQGNIYSQFATSPPLTNLRTPNEQDVQRISNKWGKWNFWDGDEDSRPTDDFLSRYPNKDIPGNEFPENAWQTDAVYVNHFLSDADLLVTRAMEAIYAEYGHPREGLTPDQIVNRSKTVFHWLKLDPMKEEQPEDLQWGGERGLGGWTPHSSHDGLVRRLLHAMMTSDTFTVVTAGNSIATGSGNKFQQSYTMQFHKIMAPIFARLGVKLVSRNIAHGGLGTVQNSLGFSSIYGDDIDMLFWDAGMSEGGKPHHVELFGRQALLSGKKVPVIWASMMHYTYLQWLYNEAGADIAEFGLATDGLPIVENTQQAESTPWATRYMKCTSESKSLCKEHPRFLADCWIERDDGVAPTVEQVYPNNYNNWHPGWRHHQLVGRNLAFGLLIALQDAIDIWKTAVAGGPPLPDSVWHLTMHYENTRSKVRGLNISDSFCYTGFNGILPVRVCQVPMKGATQYTPRANAASTGITSIAKHSMDGTPKNKKVNLFEGPEPPNPGLQIPEGEVDVFSIVSARRRRLQQGGLAAKSGVTSANSQRTGLTNRTLTGATGIEPGSGWEVVGEPSGVCDGTYNAICNRGTDNKCVLLGKQDARGSVIGTEESGWLVLNLSGVKEGLIMLNLEVWHEAGSLVEATNSSLTIEPQNRRLKNKKPSEQPETMVFEYAIDGHITSLSRDDFFGQLKNILDFSSILTILDDPEFTSESKDVELAIRMRGCGNSCTYGLPYVYWA